MRMSDVSLEARDHDSDDWDAEIRAGQVDGDDSTDPCCAQAFQLPAEIPTQIIRGITSNLLEWMGRALLAQGVEQRIDNIGSRRLLVFRRQQIVANARDVGETGLRRLGQRSGQ